MKYAQFVSTLLDNACPSMTKEEADATNEGFNRYYMEVHCKAFIVEAKKIDENTYTISSGPLKGKQVTQGMWEIRSCVNYARHCHDNDGGVG